MKTRRKATWIFVTVLALFGAYWLLPNSNPQSKKLTHTEERGLQDILSIKTQLNSYRLLAGRYPSAEQGLSALAKQPVSEPLPKRWAQLLVDVPVDPWGNQYVYVIPGTQNPSGYDLFSKGPDGAPHTADDLGL